MPAYSWCVCQGFLLPRHVRCAESMAASGKEKFESLTRRHGIKITSRASVEDCSLAVGEAIGYDNIVSAARMNSAIVLFLSSVDLVNAVVESGVVIDGTFTSVFPLSSPSKKVIISNVPPFIKDDVLIETLSRYGKLVSPIRKIVISTNSSLIRHIVSHRRFVYMTVTNNKDLDLTLNVTVEGFNYPIYISTCLMKCFSCGQTGHLARACPDKREESVTDKPNEAGNVKPQTTEEVSSPDNTGSTTERVEAEVSKAEATLPHTSSAASLLAGEDDVHVEPEVIQDVEASQTSVLDEKQSDENDAEDESSQMEAEELGLGALFKVPRSRHKRRRSQTHESTKNKTAKVHDKVQSKTANESESEFDSDCSVSCSMRLSGYASQSYTVDDIKKFLTQTKHARKLQIDKYFPDVEQFMTKAKSFISEGLVTKREGYRLRKFITRLNILLGDTDNDDK